MLALGALLATAPAVAMHGHDRPGRNHVVRNRVIHRVIRIAPMPAAKFWAIIGRTTAAGSDQDAQLRRLRAELGHLQPAGLIAFQSAFDSQLRRAYSWDLWGAGFIIRGGMSDDSFEYFRCWLIGRGQRFFEAALANPDALADLLPVRGLGNLDFEALARVAPMAWSTRTGDAPELMPRQPAQPADANPTGTKFDDDEDYLAERYPRVWKRFGEAPLG